MSDYIKAADLHTALVRVRDETKAKVWAEAYAAGRKDEQDQYAKAIQLVTLGRALTGGQQVVTQPLGNTSGTAWEQFLAAPTTVADPVAEAARNVKAFAENPALPRRENPDGPAYGKLLQLTEGWVHPDGAVTVLHSPAEAHVAALAEADPGVSQAFHASLARHAHRKHPGEFVDDDVKDYAFDKGFIHLTGRGRTIEATGKHEMLLKHRKFLKELAMRATTLVFRPVDGDDYEVKAKREGKAIPANPRHRTADVLGTHAVVQDALSRGDTQYANRQREIHADALDDAGAVREAALERVLAGQQPASHLAATFKNAANLKRAARSRTEAAHGTTEEAYQQSLDNGPLIGDTNGIVIDHAGRAFDWSHGAQFSSRLGEQKAAGEHHDRAAWRHDRTAAGMIERGFPELAALHRHAAEQHRIAAAYNAAAHYADTQRTVKAQDFEEGASVAHMPAAKFTPEQMTDIHRYNSHMSDHMDEHGQIHQLYGEETPGLRTQEQYLTSGKLLEESDRLGHAEHVRRYHPKFDPHHANEMMLDAADIGDEPGHRYWRNRLADTHLLLQEAAEKEGHDALRNAHRDAYRKLSGNHYFSSSETAHAILAHGGDVGAAAKAATKIALDMTKPGSMVYTKRGEEHAVLFRPMSHADTAAAHSEAATAIDAQPYEYRPLTRDDIDNRLARTSYHAIFSKGPNGGMVHHKVNGTLQTWKTRPGEFRLPTKTGGMYGRGSEITHANLHEFYTIDEAPGAARRAARDAHYTAAALHREAATGDHLNREVKAIRTNYAKMEQHEGSHEPQVGDYDEDDADTSNPVHSQFYRSEKLFNESERAGHLHTLQRQYPDFDPHVINEKVLDAADLGDAAGHRYWKRRLADAHLMMHFEQDTSSGPGGHYDQALTLSGNSTFSPAHIVAAHMVVHHKGDVGAAAKAAGELAIKETPPDMLGHVRKVMGDDPFRVRPGKEHTDAAINHDYAAQSVKFSPETYRPLTHADMERYAPGTHHPGLYVPAAANNLPAVHGTDKAVVYAWNGIQHGSNPGEFSMDVMTPHGVKIGTVTHENVGDYHTIDTDARDRRNELVQMHQVAALLHREASTGDHLNREVKAVRWNTEKAEHHEGVPGAMRDENSDDTYVGDYHEDDAGPEPVHSPYHRSNALLDNSDEHVSKLADRYPHLDPRQVNENMLDAADTGDEAGHRYWKRRLGDVHLMLAGEAHAAGDNDLAAEHDKFATHLHGKSGNQLDEEHEAAAHLIAHHKGDVAAAARHASEAAIKATDPELVKNVATKGPTNSDVSGPHYDAYHYHLDAVRSISHAPDTYRPLTLHDIDRHEAGEFVQFFRKPRTPGESPHMRTFSVGKVRRGSSPNEFHLPAYSGQAITHENMHDVETIDTDAHQHRLDLQQMHQVAALLHREAATGDHEKREVKAERKAFAPGIEAKPGAAGRTLHPTAGHPAADNNEAALHAAMLVQPHDMTPRMVLADYYDDHDQPHTAALHRFVAEPTRSNFDTLAAFHEHPSEVAHTVEHAAAMHADATIPRWVAVDRGVDYEDERRHPATGAIPPTGLRNELNNVIHRNAYHPSVQRFPADSPSRTERRLTRDSLMWHHQRYGEEQANFAAAHADPSTVADWGPDPISETGHAFAHTLHHAAAEAHRHARDYLTEQDALDKPTTNDGPIPEGVWRHPRLGREGKAIADPAPHGYCPDCKGVNSDEKTCPTCGAFDKNPKYSYVGVELTGEMADYLRSAGVMIPDADLAKDGRETNPHVTVRYGLHENDGYATHATLTGVGPVSVRFASKLAVFSNKDADVIHVPVRSGGLRRLNGMLAALPHTDTHDGYKPHATIAYVKPGLGAKYIKELPAPPATRDTIGTVTFSNPAKTTRVINLEAE